MNDFFDQIVFDNSVRSYAIVLGVILFILILKKFISRWLAGLLFKVVNKIWKDIDRKSFIDLVVKPLGFFLLILFAISALHKLNFPEELNAGIYKTNVKAIIHCLGTIILIVSFTGLLLRIIDFIAMILEKKADLTPDQTDNQLIIFFKDFFKVVLVIISIMLIMRYGFDLNISSLVTGLSIVGAAIALALRESIENLIASFIIFFDKPFTIGDSVKVLNVTGAIEKIGLRSTRIRTDQKTHVTVPNKQMVDSVVENLSQRTFRRADLKLNISISATSTQLHQFVEGLRMLVQRNTIDSSNAYLLDIVSGSYEIHAEYFTAPVTIEEFHALKQEINLAVIRLMEESKLELAIPYKPV